MIMLLDVRVCIILFQKQNGPSGHWIACKCASICHYSRTTTPKIESTDYCEKRGQWHNNVQIPDHFKVPGKIHETLVLCLKWWIFFIQIFLVKHRNEGWRATADSVMILPGWQSRDCDMVTNQTNLHQARNGSEAFACISNGAIHSGSLEDSWEAFPTERTLRRQLSRLELAHDSYVFCLSGCFQRI